MTSEEIQATKIPHPPNDVEGIHDSMVLWLKEIALQMAKRNEHLERSFYWFHQKEARAEQRRKEDREDREQRRTKG